MPHTAETLRLRLSYLPDRFSSYMDYLKLLVDEIHSTTVATIGSDGHPQTRIIDMMYYDEEGVYFLTAKGKAFYISSWQLLQSPSLLRY